jgi:hypothetical protein
VWFSLLNKQFGVTGTGRIAVKLKGKGLIEGQTAESALEELKCGL